MSVNSDIITPVINKLETGNTIDLHGLRGSSAAFFVAGLAKSKKITGKILCLVSSDEQLEPLVRDISLFSDSEVLAYPSFEIPPYTPLAPDPATVASRLATLHALVNNSGSTIVVTSAEALLRRILPKKILDNHTELIIRGEDIDRDELIRGLVDSGYEICSMVRQPGDLAVRGSILDIFAPQADPTFTGPVRLDFFGDTVESIRVFDPVSQRSVSELDEVVIPPGSDIIFPASWNMNGEADSLAELADEFGWSREAAARVARQLEPRARFAGIEFYLPLLHPRPNPPETLLDYLGPGAITVRLDPIGISQRIELLHERIQANYAEALDGNIAAVPPARLFIEQEELEQALRKHKLINIRSLPDPDSTAPGHEMQTGDHSLLKQDIELHRRKRGILAPLADRVLKWLEHGDSIILACQSASQARHLRDMLAGYHIKTSRATAPLDPGTPGEPGTVCLVEHPLSRGFDLIDEKAHILSAGELFGEKRLRPKSRGAAAAPEGEPIAVESLNVGDIVAHKDHGLGVFQGLINMEFAGLRGDFMQIEYQGNDKLYVPIDRLHWVSRYQGLTEQQPRLDRLGSERWQSAKKKVTDAVWQVAQELIDIYARRAMLKGRSFSPAGELYNELEESFPYEETSGQKRAISECLNDLTSERPMDRLVCGDVGYGKTEVAVRAAFKVIEDGYQVALLVPTTVLAEQHAATFRDRFSSFPARVACLNRFRPAAEQKKIINQLAAGEIDLVVGTHRLLSKDVVINKLGLLIIDEEHRFGVAHKEKIKKLRTEVDVLTLTATPIPRTLQMSLLGIRDLSVISTPPRMRRSVKTFLAKYEDLVIREAVIRELQRGGQLYFVHNRVRSIHRVAESVEQLVPGARIGVAHGQMSGAHLEKVMISFINHEIDVLVCTTIIESGLDIPNANTIIINRADQLGLADIYQLRGRVGRSNRQSYAYLLIPSLDGLTNDARERLKALMDCNELGAGFKLAMNDLQIRGGGNLLGVSQSGHIAAVGYDLYLELLQNTVADLQKKAGVGEDAGEPDIDPEIKLRVAAFLPDHYVTEATERYHLYRRISIAGNNSPAELADLRDELEDRYGAPPQETRNLFQVIGLKYHLRCMGIAKLEQGPDALIFSFSEQSRVDPQKILALINSNGKNSTGKNKKNIRLTPDHRLIVPLQEGVELFELIESILQALKLEH